jgi:Integrase core domain
MMLGGTPARNTAALVSCGSLNGESYVYGSNRLTLEQVNDETGAVQYLHHDQQGSTRLLTGSTGTRKPRHGLIHHSDGGSQYTSLALGKTLAEAGVLQSVGRRGDAFDAVAESFFATLETELFDRVNFTSRDHARIQVFEYIEGFYNPRRRHSALGYLSPDRYEATTSIRMHNNHGAAEAA